MNWLKVFGLIMSAGFALQAIKLRKKRWLLFANLFFSAIYALSCVFQILAPFAGIVTAISFVKPSMDKSRDFRFRVSHLIILMLGVIYAILSIIA